MGVLLRWRMDGKTASLYKIRIGRKTGSNRIETLILSFSLLYSGYDHQVPNPAQPGYFYSLAKYKCDEGYESPILRMFCSDGEWMGKQPQCTKLELEEKQDQTGSNRCTTEEAAKCQHICVKTEDNKQPVCHCTDGYISSSGQCTDIDECLFGNGGCDQICVNKPGKVQRAELTCDVIK